MLSSHCTHRAPNELVERQACSWRCWRCWRTGTALFPPTSGWDGPLVYVGLLVGVCRGARVKTDVTKTVHYDSIDQVDSLSGSSKIHLCPVVFRGGGVGVSRGRGGSHTSVSMGKRLVLRKHILSLILTSMVKLYWGQEIQLLINNYSLFFCLRNKNSICSSDLFLNSSQPDIFIFAVKTHTICRILKTTTRNIKSCVDGSPSPLAHSPPYWYW